MKYSFVLLLLLCCPLASVCAQSAAKIKRQAEQLFEERRYEESLAEYYKIKEKYKQDPSIYYNIGVALFETNEYTNSIQNLHQHRLQARKATPMAAYYLARANHLQDSFLTAAKYYKQYLRLLEVDAPQRPVLKRLILQCVNGPKIQQINSKAIVTGLGQAINSKEDDYRICFNPQQPNSIFFSSKRPLYEDGRVTNLYRANKEQGTFLPALPLQARYNTPLNETLLSFFDEGYQLVLLKELSDGSSSIFKDNFDEDSVEVLLPFSTNLTSDAWDSEYFFVNDSMLLFASNRSGGFGGSDLYYAVRQEGIWQTPVNLGKTINGPQDETGPFLATDGLQLFFNSNRAEGMGGHDIYKAVFDKSSNQFASVENMGIPLNSSGDDKDFILQKDPYKGYLSSNRMGGLGGLDLYAVYFRTGLVPASTGSSISFIEYLQKSRPSLATTIDSVKTTNVSTNTTEIVTGAPEQYTLTPLYYEANTGQLKGSRNSLLSLEKLLKKHPQVQVVLSAHSNQESDPSTDLYLTVKQAESTAQLLLNKGIRNEQILLRGCSQNYPLASPKNFDGSDNSLAKTINQRINITLYNKDKLPSNVTIELIEPTINTVMQSQAAARYQKKLSGLSYKVRLTETPSIFQHEVLQQHQDITTEKRPKDNNVTYLVGLEKTFVDIKYTYNKLLEKGFDNVQIIAYVDGWPITISKAQTLLGKHPDLKLFLDYSAAKH
ncbi:MAG: hypothetical protein ACRBFS_19245 [Aureispira sp.]